MKIVSYIFLSISAFFFWASQISRQSKRGVVVENPAPGMVLSNGIFVEKVNMDGTFAFLCANSSIGFYYKDHIYEEEVVGHLADKSDFDAVFEYLADKIDECEALAGKLNALQRGVQEQQAL